MKNVIITQLKDQSDRIKDWILYHHEQGFDTFIMYDDSSEDDTVEKMKLIRDSYNINIIINKSDGFGNVYSFENCKNSESYHGDVTLSDRIRRSFTSGNNIVKSINPDAISVFVDVDEFLVSNLDEKISTTIENELKNRNIDQLVINSFDVLDDGYELGDWYTTNKRTSKRWDSLKFKEYGLNRYKSLVISAKMDEAVHVHYLRLIEGRTEATLQELIDSKYRIDDYKLRIHHFRKPNLQFNIEYTDDFTLINKMNEIKDKYKTYHSETKK
jgi:hypothetical protein